MAARGWRLAARAGRRGAVPLSRCTPLEVRSAARAARWPLMTALSMVAGRPVSIQSPARKNPGTAVPVAGRARLAGGQREGGATFANRGAAQQPDAAHAGQRRRQIGVRAGDDRLVAEVGDAVGAAAHQRHAGGLAGRELAPVERPLEGPPRQPDERQLEHRPIEPQVGGDDRRVAHGARSGDRRLQSRRRVAAAGGVERVPWHRGDDRAGLDPFALDLDAARPAMLRR